jgi:hypothetical protein
VYKSARGERRGKAKCVRKKVVVGCAAFVGGEEDFGEEGGKAVFWRFGRIHQSD